MAAHQKDLETVQSMHEAIEHNDLSAVQNYLSEPKDKVLALCLIELLPFGTALHHAAGKSDRKIVELILNTGIDVNVKQTESPITQDQTPLHIAALAGKAEIVEMLLSRGGNVNAQESAGHTPLHCACSGNNLNIVQTLIKYGASVNMSDYCQESPLQRSILRSSNEVILCLIDSGADINALDPDGQTLLHYAVEWDNQEIVGYLLKKGININSQDNNGCTPLHLAENDEMLNMLIQHGADTNLRDNTGQPPITKQIDMEREDLQNINKALERHLNIGGPSTRVQPSEEKAAAVQEFFNKLVLPSVPGEEDAASGHSGLMTELLNRTQVATSGGRVQDQAKSSPLASAGVLDELKYKSKNNCD